MERRDRHGAWRRTAVIAASLAALGMMVAAVPQARAAKQPMWVVQGTGGTLTGPSEGDLTLVIDGVTPRALLMRDRPIRPAGTVDVADIVHRWRATVADRASATLAVHLPDRTRQTEMVLAVRSPAYDPVRRRLAFRAQRVDVRPDNLPDATRRLRAERVRTPARFGEASVFIAGDPAPRHRGAMLWSLAGTGASLVRSGSRMNLVIRGARGRAIRFGEQPVRRANVVALEDLAQRWPHWFAKAAPNAALVAGTGRTRLTRVVVLGRPVYDRERDSVAFPIRRMSGPPIGPRRLGRPVLYIDDVAGATVYAYGCTGAMQAVSIPGMATGTSDWGSVRVITIEAWGAQGGTGNLPAAFPGGRGGYATKSIVQQSMPDMGYPSLSLRAYVGCQGPTTQASGGGGGSSAVLDANGTIMVVAGGGGGGSAGPTDDAYLSWYRAVFNANGGSGGGDGGGLDGDPDGKPGMTWTTPSAQGGAAGQGGAGGGAPAGWGAGGSGGDIGSPGGWRTADVNATFCSTIGPPAGYQLGYPWQWAFGGWGYGWGGASGFLGCGGPGSGGGGGAQHQDGGGWGGGGGGGGYGGGGGGSTDGENTYELAGGGGGGGSYPASPVPSVVRTGDGAVVVTIDYPF